jgi:trk system potassium uptake protein TrkA
MNVMIIGGGKTGAQLTRRLVDEGNRVVLFEKRIETAERLKKEFPAGIVVTGDGSSPGALEAAGILSMQVLAAVTGEDETNLVVATLARFEFNVPRIIARVNNPKNAWLFTPEMGVDVGLNQTDLLASLIAEEMSLGDMMTLHKLRRGKFSLVEEKLPPRSEALGIPLKDLTLPPTCVIAAVIRAGEIVIPRGDLIFEVGDEVLAIVDAAAKAALKDVFSPAGGGSTGTSK